MMSGRDSTDDSQESLMDATFQIPLTSTTVSHSSGIMSSSFPSPHLISSEQRSNNQSNNNTIGSNIGNNNNNNKGERGQCNVCGEKAFYNFYGSLACDSCRTFFRRHVLQRKHLMCDFNNCCDVTTKTRKECSKCRLKKCFEAGMRVELVAPNESERIRRGRSTDLDRLAVQTLRVMGDQLHQQGLFRPSSTPSSSSTSPSSPSPSISILATASRLSAAMNIAGSSLSPSQRGQEMMMVRKSSLHLSPPIPYSDDHHVEKIFPSPHHFDRIVGRTRSSSPTSRSRSLSLERVEELANYHYRHPSVIQYETTASHPRPSSLFVGSDYTSLSNMRSEEMRSPPLLERRNSTLSASSFRIGCFSPPLERTRRRIYSPPPLSPSVRIPHHHPLHQQYQDQSAFHHHPPPSLVCRAVGMNEEADESPLRILLRHPHPQSSLFTPTHRRPLNLSERLLDPSVNSNPSPSSHITRGVSQSPSLHFNPPPSSFVSPSPSIHHPHPLQTQRQHQSHSSALAASSSSLLEAQLLKPISSPTPVNLTVKRNQESIQQLECCIQKPTTFLTTTTASYPHSSSPSSLEVDIAKRYIIQHYPYRDRVLASRSGREGCLATATSTPSTTATSLFRPFGSQSTYRSLPTSPIFSSSSSSQHFFLPPPSLQHQHSLSFDSAISSRVGESERRTSAAVIVNIESDEDDDEERKTTTTSITSPATSSTSVSGTTSLVASSSRSHLVGYHSHSRQLGKGEEEYQHYQHKRYSYQYLPVQRQPQHESYQYKAIVTKASLLGPPQSSPITTTSLLPPPVALPPLATTTVGGDVLTTKTTSFIGEISEKSGVRRTDSAPAAMSSTGRQVVGCSIIPLYPPSSSPSLSERIDEKEKDVNDGKRDDDNKLRGWLRKDFTEQEKEPTGRTGVREDEGEQESQSRLRQLSSGVNITATSAGSGANGSLTTTTSSVEAIEQLAPVISVPTPILPLLPRIDGQGFPLTSSHLMESEYQESSKGKKQDVVDRNLETSEQKREDEKEKKVVGDRNPEEDNNSVLSSRSSSPKTLDVENISSVFTSSSGNSFDSNSRSPSPITPDQQGPKEKQESQEFKNCHHPIRRRHHHPTYPNRESRSRLPKVITSSADRMILEKISSATSGLSDGQSSTTSLLQGIQCASEELTGREYHFSFRSGKVVAATKILYIGIKRIVSACRFFGPFKELPEEQQRRLLREACSEMLLLRSVYHANLDSDVWEFLSSSTSLEKRGQQQQETGGGDDDISPSYKNMARLPISILKKVQGSTLYPNYRSFVSIFEEKWRGNSILLTIMMAIVLFDPSRRCEDNDDTRQRDRRRRPSSSSVCASSSSDEEDNEHEKEEPRPSSSVDQHVLQSIYDRYLQILKAWVFAVEGESGEGMSSYGRLLDILEKLKSLRDDYEASTLNLTPEEFETFNMTFCDLSI